MTYERTSLSAMLALVVGCGGDIQVGDQAAISCGDPRGDCTELGLQLATPNRALRVDAEARALTPRWTISTLGSPSRAPDGGAWLVSAGSPIRAQRIDAEGNTLRVVELPQVASRPAPSPGAVFVPGLFPASAHPLGPTVVVSWQWLCQPDAAQCSVSNEVRETQVLVIPEDGAAPFDLLASDEQVGNDVHTATRSADGQRMLLQGFASTRLYTLAGELLWEQSLYDTTASRGGDFVALGADSFMTWARDRDGSAALVKVEQGSVERRRILDAPFSENVGTRTLILPGGVAGEYVLALERSIAYPEASGPLNSDPSPSVPGDLSVVRVRDGAVVDEHLLRRADLPLELDAAAMDDAGNVYLATANAEQDPVTAALTVTPLLCRFAPLGEASCFVLPERAASLQAGPPNSVLVSFRRAGTLARYDLPAAP